MLSNAYFLAKFRFDTAENDPAKNLQNLVILLNFPSFANPNPEANEPLNQGAGAGRRRAGGRLRRPRGLGRGPRRHGGGAARGAPMEKSPRVRTRGFVGTREEKRSQIRIRDP